MAGIVIVGAGHAGVQLAATLRETGYEGALRLVSADPDIPYHKPPLSKSFMKTPDASLCEPAAKQAFARQQTKMQGGLAALMVGGLAFFFHGGRRSG